MKTFTLHHPFEAADRHVVYDILRDFRKFGEIHPLMREVKVVGQPRPGVTTYFVKEEAVVGGIKMKPQYKVHGSEPIPGESILYTARINLIVNLRITFSFTQPDAGGKIHLVEQVEVTRLPIITKLFWDTFQKAHLEVFGDLAKQLKERRIAKT